MGDGYAVLPENGEIFLLQSLVRSETFSQRNMLSESKQMLVSKSCFIWASTLLTSKGEPFTLYVKEGQKSRKRSID